MATTGFTQQGNDISYEKKHLLQTLSAWCQLIVVCITFHWGHWICKVRLYEQRRRSAIDYFAKKYFSREWSLTWNTLLAAFEYNIDLMKIEITACPLLVVTEAFLAASLDDHLTSVQRDDFLIGFSALGSCLSAPNDNRLLHCSHSFIVQRKKQQTTPWHFT